LPSPLRAAWLLLATLAVLAVYQLGLDHLQSAQPGRDQSAPAQLSTTVPPTLPVVMSHTTPSGPTAGVDESHQIRCIGCLTPAIQTGCLATVLLIITRLLRGRRIRRSWLNRRRRIRTEFVRRAATVRHRATLTLSELSISRT